MQAAFCYGYIGTNYNSFFMQIDSTSWRELFMLLGLLNSKLPVQSNSTIIFV